MPVDGSKKTRRILCYGGGWPTNIGNAFIDMGVMTILRAADPEAEIGFASEMPRFFLGSRETKKGLWRRRRANPTSGMNDALDIGSITQCDLLVFAGQSMDETCIGEIGPSLLKISDRGVPILMLGTGAGQYVEREQEKFSEFLRKFRPAAFISRDDRSYDMYASAVKEAHRGIDCGFFISEAYRPFKLDLPPYVAVNFDAGPVPPIETNGRSVLYAHHQCLGRLPDHYFGKPNTLISDIPQDYLTFYANAEEIHSDRVHACVAGLSYGRKVRLYHPTPRGSLFEAAGVVGIREGLVSADQALLSQKRRSQIELVRQIIQTVK